MAAAATLQSKELRGRVIEKSEENAKRKRKIRLNE